MFDARKLPRQNLWFLLFLLVLVTAYAVYFFSFTLFDGFATISNDSFNYILLARKWSPFFEPSIADTLTWPALAYPPGFSWFLAITGASESNYLGHLLVSVAMLASLALVGWYAYSHVGWFAGGLFTLCAALLPGVIISSLGILSENLYLLLSLAVLILVSAIRKNGKSDMALWLALAFCLVMAVLTRTIGIALAGALLVVPIFDRTMAKRTRIMLISSSGLSLLIWKLWPLFDPQGTETTYVSFMTAAFGNQAVPLVERLGYYFSLVHANAVTLIGAWNHYFTLSLPRDLFFWFSLLLLAVCLTATALRAVKLKVSAVYVVLFLGITLAWPYPEELLRYLHPVIFLLFLQPALYVYGSVSLRAGSLLKPVLMVTLLVVVAITALAQSHLYSLRKTAKATMPGIAHALEYYSIPSQREAEYKAVVFQDALRLMASTADIVPPASIVAVAQHTPFSVLSDRPAVIHSEVIPYSQQLCNFTLTGAEYLFLSTVTDSFNPNGIKNVDTYKTIASEVWTLEKSEGRPGAYLLKLDPSLVASALTESGFHCDSVRVIPGA